MEFVNSIHISVIRNLLAFILISLTSLSSCNYYTKDFSKIEIENFELINENYKTLRELRILRNNESKFFQARIKFRGGSSIGYPKKNFTINLDKEYKFKGAKKDDDWILNASVVDKTFLRNVFSYKLFRDFNSKNEAPQTSYADIYANGEYYGFYVVCERLDISSLKLDRENDALVFKEPAVFRLYQQKLDSLETFLGHYYHQKHPKIENKYYEIDSLKDFILFASDSLFEAEIFNKIDVSNLLDWHVLLELTNNADGLLKNFVLYKKSAEEKFRVAIWDFDHSFGRDGDNELNMLRNLIDVKQNILLKRLLGNLNLNYNQMISKRWKQLREKDKISIKEYKKYLTKEANKIRPFVKKNFKQWPLTGWPYNDANDFDEEVEIMFKYIELRIPQLDSLYNYKGK